MLNVTVGGIRYGGRRVCYLYKEHPQFGHEGAETEQACPQSGQFLNLPWLLADRAVDSSLSFGINRTSQRAHVVTSLDEGVPQEGQNDSFIMWLLVGLMRAPKRAGRFHLSSTERWRAVGQ